jgi:hypothetical protein
MLMVGAVTTLITLTSAIINVRMSAHALADKVTHHWRALIVSTKTATIQFHNGSIRAVNSPSRSRHRTMACFMLLLGVAWMQEYELKYR